MNRLRGIVRTLPRIKLEHIQPDINLEYERSMRITPEQAKMQKKNKPIYLWDGSPLHTSMKPSIGAEHFFRKGFFWGSDGKKKKYLDQRRRYGTQNMAHHERMLPSNVFNIDERTNGIYEPITLFDIQRLVDLGRLDAKKIIDITAIINARLMKPSEFLWSKDILGIRLVSEGADVFEAKLNIEFQMADELAIATVEKNGGKFTASYYDRGSIEAAVNPVDYFLKGNPVRKRLLPPEHLFSYYSSPETRGYLADKDLYEKYRHKTSQKYGYELQPLDEYLMVEKHPREIWVGISPGSLVNLQDKAVYIRTDPNIQEILRN